MDVRDVQKLHLAVRVKFLGLVALAGHFIAERSHLIPRVVYNAVDLLFFALCITQIVPLGSY